MSRVVSQLRPRVLRCSPEVVVPVRVSAETDEPEPGSPSLRETADGISLELRWRETESLCRAERFSSDETYTPSIAFWPASVRD